MHRKYLQEHRTCVKIFWMFVKEIVGGTKMFLAALIEAIIKMVIIGAVAYGGIILGRYLRKKKDEKDEK